MAYQIYASAYHPRGNGMNEAVHKELERSLTARLWSSSDTFDEALTTAVAVHNATPHSSTGVSPYFFLFGCEPCLPGWQKHVNQHEGALRQQRRHELHQRALLREKLVTDQLKLRKKEVVKEGEWVVYYLSDAERLAEARDEKTTSYSPHWSMPAKVQQVKSTTVVVEDWGHRGIARQVPIANVRRLAGSVPPSLQTLALHTLEYAAPRAMVPRSLRSGGPAGRSSQWQEFLDGTKAAAESRKRQRRQLI